MSYKPGKAVVAAVLLSFATSVVPIGPAYAALVPTENLIAAHEISADRETVASFMAREDVQNELIKYGVDQNEAALRVVALSDQEVRDIAARIDELPAGQDAGTAIISAAVTIFIILLITDLLCLTSVFNFTRCAR
jgi:hypothetical protein